VHMPLVVCLLLTCLARAAGFATDAPAIEGKIRDAAGGEAVARVRVVLACADGESETLSGADGTFRFVGAAGRVCLLQASMVGYRPLAGGARRRGDRRSHGSG
jgi:hypothetical protein